MPLEIVPAYAALLALFYMFLSIRVIGSRRSEKVSLGDGGNQVVRRRMRVHANFAEYAPLCLLLIAFIELQGGTGLRVHILCLLLLAGRLAHAYGVGGEPQKMPLRVAGMVLTFAVLVGGALENLLIFATRSG